MEVKFAINYGRLEGESEDDRVKRIHGEFSKLASIKKLRRTAGASVVDPERARMELHRLLRTMEGPSRDEAALRRIAREAGRAERLARALIARKALERMGEL